MAKVNFTANRIDNFACEQGQTQDFLWDAAAPGLGLRATANGAKAYIFQTKLDRKTIRITIGTPATWSVSAAQTEARRLKTLTDQGFDPRQIKAEKIAADQASRVAKEAEETQAIELAKRESMTVGQAWLEFLKHHEKRWGERHMTDHINLAQAGGMPKKRGKGETVQGVLYPLLQKRMVDITGTVLKEWQQIEAQTRANNARQGFEMFRAFWRWCATRDEYKKLIDLNAVEDNDLRAEVPSRKSKKFDVLQRAQMEAWFAAIKKISNPVISAYLQALVLTGARREEMAALRWQDVDFKWNYMWIKDKVDEEGRKLPLPPYLASLLSALTVRNEYVFSSLGAKDGKLAEPSKAHKKALKDAQLPHVTLHGLRRTFGSLAEWVEMPRGVVAQIMGHAPSATAEKHYINRPLELLAVWHCKYEAWILEQAKVEFQSTQAGLRGIAEDAPVSQSTACA